MATSPPSPTSSPGSWCDWSEPAVLLLGVLVVCWFEDYRMGIAITIYVVAVLGLLVSLRKLAVKAAEEEREVSARLYGFIEERLAGIEDIRALGAGRFTMGRFIPVMRDFFARTTAAWRKRVIVWVSANTAFWAGDALALAVGTWLTVQGSITVGTAYLILQYAQLVRRPIEQVTKELQQLQKAAGGIIRVDQPPSSEHETGGRDQKHSRSGHWRSSSTRQVLVRGPGRARRCLFPAGARHRARAAGTDRWRKDDDHPADRPSLRP